MVRITHTAPSFDGRPIIGLDEEPYSRTTGIVSDGEPGGISDPNPAQIKFGIDLG